MVGSQGDCVHTLPILTGDCVHTVFTLTYTAVVGSQSDCVWIQVPKLYAPIFSGLVSERLINPRPASIFKLQFMQDVGGGASFWPLSNILSGVPYDVLTARNGLLRASFGNLCALILCYTQTCLMYTQICLRRTVWIQIPSGMKHIHVCTFENFRSFQS